MNILIVKAHPSSLGHVHRIADTYAKAKQAKGDTVQIVDLYAAENREEFLTFENIREMVPPPVQKKFEDQITWADEIVIVHPIWWGLPPAIMKNWVDLTFWNHFAYKFSSDGDMIPMLKGKTAKVFATAGGPSFIYYLPFFPLRQFWGLMLFRSAGIELIDFKICGYLDKWQGEKANTHFENFLKKIEASA